MLGGRPRSPVPGLPDPELESEAIEVRQELRRQIGRLEAELATYTRHLTAELPTAPRRAVAHVAGVQELEQTRDTLIAQLSGGAEGGGAAGTGGGAGPRQRPARQGDELVALEAVTRRLGAVGDLLHRGGEHDDPHREDDRLRGAGRPTPSARSWSSSSSSSLKLCWFPLLISTFALNLGAPGLQAAGILSLFGALDRLGGFFVLTAIRWIGPLVTAVVVAGVAGTAITADLGARKIREELDALQVLGVDPIKNLVVPRFLALMVVTGLLDIFAIVFGLTAGIAAELLYNQSLGGFFATLFSNATITDISSSVLMCTLFGAIIAIVCSYKGMSASGGAAGVGRAVNQAVVIALVAVFFFQFVVTSILLRHQPRAAGDPVIGWLDVPRGWLDSFGEIARFGSRVAGLVLAAASSASSARGCARRGS